MTPYKLTLHNGEVIAIRPEDLPNQRSYFDPLARDDFQQMAAKEKYRKALSAAMSEKGVKVDDYYNTLGILFRDQVKEEFAGSPDAFRHWKENILKPGTLYDVPEGFELDIDWKDGDPRTTVVATLIPKEQPKEDDQDKLCYDLIQLVESLDSETTMDKIQAIKSQFTLTRKP